MARTRMDTGLVAQLELCIIENSGPAWAKFLEVQAEMVAGVFLSHGKAKDREEFTTWFPGWLYQKRKLHSAYRALRNRIQNGELPTEESQEHYLKNYFSNIVRSATSEFYSESQQISIEGGMTGQTHQGSAGDDRVTSYAEKEAQIKAALKELPRELRIPFWLKYYHICGMPEREDILWMAEASGVEPLRISNAIQEEADQNLQRKYPLSSRFIAELVGIPPTVDGSYAAVDQRVRRTLVRLKEILNPPGDGD